MAAEILIYARPSSVIERFQNLMIRAGYDVASFSDEKLLISRLNADPPDFLLFLLDDNEKQIHKILSGLQNFKKPLLSFLLLNRSISDDEKTQWISAGIDGFIVLLNNVSLAFSQLHSLSKLLPFYQQYWTYFHQKAIDIADASYPLLLLKPDGAILHSNAAFTEMTKFPAGKIIDMNIFDLLSFSKTSETPGWHMFFSSICIPECDSIDLKTSNGKKIPISFAALPIRDEQRKVAQILTAIFDRCDDEKRKEKLAASLGNWRQVFNALNYPTVILDRQHKILAANDETIFALAMTEEELVGKYCYEIFHEQAKGAKSGCPFKQLLEKGYSAPSPMEMEALGGIFLISCTPIWDKSGQYNLIMHSAVNITEQKKAERALQKSEERFRSIYENSTMGLYRTDPDGNILMANPALVKMLGFDSFDELCQRNLESNGFHPNYPRSFFKRQLEKKGKITGLEAAWKKRNGEVIFVRESAVTIKDERGKVLYYEGTVEDITQQKLAEQKLRESELKFRSLFDHSAEAEFIVTVDEQDRFFIEEMNQSASEVYGYKLKELKGKDWKILFDRASIIDFMEIEKKVLNKEVVHLESQGKRKNGTTFPCILTVNLIEINDQRCAFLIARDITDRVEFERKLQQSEESYRSIFHQAIDAIYIQDENGVFLDVNQGAEKMYGYPRDYFIGKTPQFLSAPGKNDLKKLGGYIKKAYQGEPQTFEFWGKAKNGRIFPKIVRLSKGKYFDKDVVIAFAIDITKQKNAELALQESEEKYRSVFDNAREAFFLHEITRDDLPGKILEVNKAACELLGYTKDELLNLSVKDIVSKPDFRKAREYLKQIFRGEKTLEIKAVAKDGSLIPVEITAQGFKLGGRKVMISIMRDLRERKKAEQKLRDAAFQWRTTFDAMNDAVAVLDTDEKILRCNKAFAHLAAKPFSQLIGKPIVDLILGPNKRLKNCPILKSRKSLERESVVVNVNDRWYEIIIDPAKDDSGKLNGFIYIQKDITEQHEIEQLLRDNETKYRMLFEEAHDAIFLMQDDIFVDCNERTLEMFGCERHEIIGNTPYNFSPKKQPDGRDSKEAALEKIEAAFSGDLPTYEWLHCKLDGSEFYAEVTLTPIVLKGKKHLQAIVRDVTERKRAEKALKESEERYRHLIENSNDAIYLLFNRKFEIVNKKFTEIFGVTEEDANKPDFDFMELVAPESRPLVLERMKRLAAGEQLSPQYEFTAIDKYGQKVEFEASVSYIKYKDGLATQGILHNITERKRAERALRESEEKYRRLVEESPYAIAIHSEGKIVFANEASVKLMGAKSLEQIIGMPMMDIVHPDYREVIRERVAQAIKSRQATTNLEEKFIRLDGKEIFVETIGIPITYQGKPAMQVIVHDISDRKAAEEQIKKDLREKETLIKEIHHRVKNNLMVVTSLLSLQMRRISDREAIEAFKDSINRIYSMALVHQKLYQSKSLSDVDFKEFISTIASQTFSNYSLFQRVKLELNLQQIFLNIEKAVPLGLLLNEIMTNAMKYAFLAGREGKIQINFGKVGEKECELIVRDDGVGLPRNFDFHTSDSLGMTLIRQLADQIDGTVKVSGRRGTKFTVRFPL